MINKLIANIKKTNAPIVVGLDPFLTFRSIFRKKRLPNTAKHWKVPQRLSGSTTKGLWMP